MTDREKFEAWAINEHFVVHRSAREQYVNTPTQRAWVGWQASRRQALAEAAALCLAPDGRDVGMTGANCSAVILALREAA